MSRLAELNGWLDERVGHKKLLSALLDEPIQGGARFAYVFGSTLLGAFLVQVVTGVALMSAYAPSDKTAWASVHYISTQLSGGWLVRGLHHYGAQAMVVLLGAHMTQVAFFGAYKKPREVTWWVGLGLLALTLGFALTGYLLPWDQKGYWATRVATNIAGTIPVVGGFQQRALQGGSEYGSLTLTRFYTLHVFVLPAALAGLVAVHLALFRRHGVTPSVKADTKRFDRFFPRQMFLDTAAVLAVLGFVLYLAVRDHGAPLDAPADPSSDYPARPEWYFLALFQLLKYFHGPLELVGTVVIPTLAGLYLFALPLIDRGADRAVRPRLKVLAPLVGIGLGAVLLTTLAFRSDAADAGFQKERALADVRAKRAVELAKAGVPPEGPLAMMARDPVLHGPVLFEKHCAGCHVLAGLGTEKDRTAPVLDGWGTEAWIMQMMHDPDGDARFGRTAYKGEMPSMDVAPPGDADFKPMSKGDMQAAAAFLASQGDERGEPVPDGAWRRDPAVVKKGEEIVKARCTACHLYKGEGDDGGQELAPELSGYGSLAWTASQIRDPSSKATYRPKSVAEDRKGHMPKFERDMTAQDIEVLARWVRLKARGGP